MTTIQINGKYDENNVSQLISKFSFVFDLKGKLLKDYTFNVTIETKDFTSIAALVIYKSLAYMIDENCLQAPKANLKVITALFTKYHLNDLLVAYLRSDDRDKLYNNIKPVIKKDFFIAPHPISRIDFKNIDEIEKKYYKTIKDYYIDFNDDVLDCVKTLIVEISSNFYSHATDKNQF